MQLTTAADRGGDGDGDGVLPALPALSAVLLPRVAEAALYERARKKLAKLEKGHE